MQRREHHILCGGVCPEQSSGKNVRRLQTSGPKANIKPQLHDLSRRFVKDVPHLLTDLLEIASYVYAADGVITRGGDRLQGMGKDWRRKLDFVIPVRCRDVWQSEEIVAALGDVLGFLSDDDYSFEFRAHPDPPEFASYLDFNGERSAGFKPDEVILFSGGLDSLAGAVDRVIGYGKKALLVSHKSSPKMFSRQKGLVAALRDKSVGQVMHLPVKVQNSNNPASEFTLRSRSFLFACLAAIAARMAGMNRIHFFENGIVSLNFPIAAQVVGGRATRTTHPRTLAGFGRLFSLLFDDDFAVENPFFWKTKAEVVGVIAEHKCQDLIRGSVSCSHIRETTRYKNHCGVCSQCVDRRFGTVGAGLGDFDPEEAYAVRLLQDARETPDERNLAALYVKSSLETGSASDEAFYGEYAGELSQALRFLPGKQDETAKQIIDLHRRHAAVVRRVLADGIKAFADDFVAGKLPDSCLLKMVTGADGTLDVPSPSRQSADNIEGGPVDFADMVPPLEIRIALEDANENVLVEGLAPLSGRKTYKLFQCLAEKRKNDLEAGKAPENYSAVTVKKLADQVGSDETAIRKLVSRNRRKFSDSFLVRYGKPASETALIETRGWNGYRLNPNVLVIAPVEMRRE